MNEQQQIALAMGWQFVTEDTTPPDNPEIVRQTTNFWVDPNGNKQRNDKHLKMPDPINDANDCEALIAWLNKEGFELDILFWPEGDADLILKSKDNLRFAETSTPDWKRGVCEMALKATDARQQGTKQ